MKSETPVRSRQNRSGFRKDSRDSSNVSNDGKMLVFSPNQKQKTKASKYAGDKNDISEYYQMSLKDDGEMEDRAKTLVQPKIGGKDHSQMLSAEIFRKPNIEMKKQSFSTLKK